MSAELHSWRHPAAVPSDAEETIADGANRVTSIQLSLEQFLAGEDQRMTALIRLYQSRCSDGLPPIDESIRPEDIFSTGMMSRTHCVRIGTTEDEIRFVVWAQDANFSGYRSLQNARLTDLITDFPTHKVMFEAVKRHLAAAMLHGRPSYYEIKGLIDSRGYYFTKAILPLRSEQGEIIKCLVPFTNKLPDIPPYLRQKLLAADVD
jgi:hypothetical protein